MHGALGDSRRLDLCRWQGGQTDDIRFIHTRWKRRAGDVHSVRKLLGHKVDHKLTATTDIGA